MKNKEINLDVGAGSGKSFLRKAKENPDQYFIAVEPSMERGSSSKISPSNMLWIKGKASCEESLPIKNASVSEVNMDFVLVFLYGAEEVKDFHEEALGMIQEGLRVLKPGGSLLIREPEYILRELPSIMSKARVDFSLDLIPQEETEGHSASAREFAQEAKFGEEEFRPWLITIIKK